MSDLAANSFREAVEDYNRPKERVRHPQEILARYNKALATYKELSFTNGDVHGQKMTTYTEIKVLGWVLGKAEKTVIKDVAANSNSMPFGTF